MKILPSASIFVCVVSASYAASNYEQIPSSIRSEIKAKCVSEYPGDYFLQKGCIDLQSGAYLDVHGGAAGKGGASPKIDVTGIPSAFDRAQIGNAAFLSVAKETCNLEVGDMPKRYRARAIASDRLTEKDVDAMLSGATKEVRVAARKDRKSFCKDAANNVHIFVDDLKK